MYRWNVISAEVKKHNFKNGAEIGVAYGKNLFNVLDACPALTMIGVDMWRPVESVSDPGPQGLYGYPKVPHEHNKLQVFTKAKAYKDRLTIIEMPSMDAANNIDDGSLDFVFIDACHAEA